MPPLIIVHMRGTKDKNKQEEINFELVFVTDRIAWNPDTEDLLVTKDGEDLIFQDLTYLRVSDTTGYVQIDWQKREELNA